MTEKAGEGLWEKFLCALGGLCGNRKNLRSGIPLRKWKREIAILSAIQLLSNQYF